jgi:hypothetical protein
MTRGASKADFVVTVDGIGTFTFGRRVFRDQFAIGAAYARLSEGQPLDQTDSAFANMVAELQVLTVAAPPEWDIDTLDPEDGYGIIRKVWSALRDKEIAFRGGVPVRTEAQGAGGGADNGDLVPPTVQPAAD